ncbi:PH domain-containing protein [Hoyosella rhizosphaerae]|nr:PH domain-containing protein [Hoyosella rhizosphaerae]
MLFVKPITAGVRALPAIIVPLILGAQTGNPMWILIAVFAFVYIAAIDWITTRYRVGPEHVQLKTGLLRRNVLSIPRSRVRSVDVRATVLHRLLKLSVLRIGTGQSSGALGGGSSFELDAIPSESVPELRSILLAGGRAEDTDSPESDAAAETPLDVSDGPELAKWTPKWTRYAPLSFTGVVALAAGFGLLFQSGAAIDRIVRSDIVINSAEFAEQIGPIVAAAIGVIAILIAASIIAMARYFITFSGFTLHDDGRTLRVKHGLLSTRESTLDRRRLRGVTIEEPLLLRLVGAGRVRAIMTGISSGSGESSLILPDAPRSRTHSVASEVLYDETLATVPLKPHGPAAFRRRMFRAMLAPIIVLAGLWIAHQQFVEIQWWGWTLGGLFFVASVPLGIDRYRSLGHAAPAGWLVCRSGSLMRARDVVAAQGIIGWTIQQTFFQRRAGLATLVAATPAGASAYMVIDIPMTQTWALIEQVTPGMTDSLRHIT